MNESSATPLLDAPRRLLLWGILGVLLVSAWLQGAGIVSATSPMILISGENAFTAMSMAAVFAIHLGLMERGTRRREWAGGLLAEAVFFAVHAFLWKEAPVGVGMGLGLFALVRRSQMFLMADPAKKPHLARAWVDTVCLPAFEWASYTLVFLTPVLRPLVWDPLVMAAESGLGFQPALWVSERLKHGPWVMTLLEAVYVSLPLAMAGVYALRRQRDGDNAFSLLLSYCLVGFSGWFFYLLFPVVGPKFFLALPGVSLEALPSGPILGTPDVPRNCMPSLHTAWVLVMAFHTRGLARPIRWSVYLYAALTLLATLAFRLHYLLDLVIAVPFAVAIDALSWKLEASRRQVRTFVLCGGLLATGAWLLMLAFGSDFLKGQPALTWSLLVLTVAWGAFLRHRLMRGHVENAVFPGVPPVMGARAFRWSVGWVGTAFVLSGIAGMLYEVSFARSLALAFGSTSLSQTIVLATYMGGIGLGSWLGALWMERRGDPLKTYAYCELGIAAWSVSAPWLLKGLQSTYAELAKNTLPSEPRALVLQVVFGASALLFPTLLMGATTPALARYFAHSREELGKSVRFLYAMNAVGAGLGALLGGYWVIPGAGLRNTFLIAVVANSVAALLALRLRKKAPTGTDTVQPPAPAPSSDAASAFDRRVAYTAMAMLLIGGMVTLALEVVFTHLLAVVAGNSAYAFSLMLSTFLIGLSAGAGVGNRLWKEGSLLPALWNQAFLALAILLGVYAWDNLPGYFASFEGYRGTRTFAQRELVRGVVCVLTMFPVAFFVGAAWPSTMAQAVKAFPSKPMTAFGVASGLNTLGNILGALGAHFLLLPNWYSLKSLHFLALLAFGLAAVPLAMRLVRWDVRLPLALAAIVLLFVVRPQSFDLTRLASGANVYFASQSYGQVIDFSESSDGGLTTVAESRDPDGNRVLTLLTNGKFQGDNSLKREVPAQYAVALVPLLHTPLRGSGLVIGYGTGTSARAVYDAGFERLSIVELSKDIYTLANKHFPELNALVSEKPNVKSYVADGRNFLLTHDERFDFISMEISSIWFAGAASLYNSEFYRLAKSRLKDDGIFQQWLQLHRLAPSDIASVLATVRHEFNSVYLYFVETQGVIVACKNECPPVPAAMAQLDAQPALSLPLQHFGGSSANLMSRVLLQPAETDAFLRGAVRAFKLNGVEALLSSDDNLLLEYSTPRRNVEPYAGSMQRNLALLRSYAKGPKPGAPNAPPGAPVQSSAE